MILKRPAPLLTAYCSAVQHVVTAHQRRARTAIALYRAPAGVARKTPQALHAPSSIAPHLRGSAGLITAPQPDRPRLRLHTVILFRNTISERSVSVREAIRARARARLPGLWSSGNSRRNLHLSPLVIQIAQSGPDSADTLSSPSPRARSTRPPRARALCSDPQQARLTLTSRAWFNDQVMTQQLQATVDRRRTNARRGGALRTSSPIPPRSNVL